MFYFHIASFAIFHVTCVVTNNSDYCPGNEAAKAAGMIDKNNVNSIEGFFIDDDLPAMGGDSGIVDVYSFSVNLRK